MCSSFFTSSSIFLNQTRQYWTSSTLSLSCDAFDSLAISPNFIIIGALTFALGPVLVSASTFVPAGAPTLAQFLAIAPANNLPPVPVLFGTAVLFHAAGLELIFPLASAPDLFEACL